jgi:hypothetical protein
MDKQASVSQNQVECVPVGRSGRQAEPGTERTARAMSGAVPWWTVLTAGAAPVLLVGGFLVASALQPVSYDPLRDTISAMAARGAIDRWVMTAAIAAVGACYLVTALGLSPARQIGRLALAGGGLATLSIAAFPTPLHGYSRLHALAVIAASITMCAWPVLAGHRRHQARVLRFGPSIAAAAVTFVLIMWFALEVHGNELGLAERCAAVSPALWLFPVALGTRRAFVDDRRVEVRDETQVSLSPGAWMDLDHRSASHRSGAT